MASSGCAFSFAVRAELIEAGAFSPPLGLSFSKPAYRPRTVRAEPVEALACWFDRHAWVEGGGRESPGVRVTFFCFAKRKSPKKRRPPVCDPFAVRRGKPAAGRLRGAPWNSLRCVAASFRHPRRVRARSMGAATPMPPRNRPAAGAASRGGAAQQPNSQLPFGPLLRSAQMSQRVALAHARWGRAKQRPVGMFGSPLPSGCAEERSGRGGMCAEGHTCFVVKLAAVV